MVHLNLKAKKHVDFEILQRDNLVAFGRVLTCSDPFA